MIASRTIEPQAAPYLDPSVAKLLSDNRDRYIAQSKATVDGIVPPIAEVAHEAD